MIAAGEPMVFVPHGKIVLDQYETNSSRRASNFNSSIEPQGAFFLYSSEECDGSEEEVYVHDNHVIWSRGNGDMYWELIKKFTCDGPVQQVLRFKFDKNYNRPACPNLTSIRKSDEEKIPSLCIVEQSKVTVITKDGDEFISAPPYEIQRVWPTKFGLIIEKHLSAGPDLPNWFSLLHPLEEIVPIVLRDNERDHVNYAKDRKLRLIFTSDNPSICVTFNEETGLHSIWIIRKAEDDETLFFGTKAFPSNTSLNGTFIPSLASPSLSRSFALSQIHNNSFQSPSLPPIFSNSSKQTPKYDPDSSRFTTPKASKSYIQHFGISSLHGGHSRLSGTPPIKRLGSSRMSAILARTPMPSPSVSSLNELEMHSDGELLLPDLCLQVLWTEDMKRSSQSAASKAFVASDWLGRTYMCWLLDDERVLRSVEIKITENKVTGNPLYISCSPWAVPARNAEYIAGLKAILTLDPVTDNSLTLYSGNTKLAKVYVPSYVPLTGISMSMQCLSLEGELNRRSLKFIPSTPLNSSRRSSLLINDRDLLHGNVTLSPIPSTSVTFKSLQDSVGYDVTIKCSDQCLLRTSLPPLATSALVERSFAALRAALPQDAYLNVAARFYCCRNAPGPSDFSPQAEWLAFCSTLQTMLGFDAKLLESSLMAVHSPVMESKKSRTNIEDGSESDWNYLIGSQYNRAFSSRLGVLLPVVPSKADAVGCVQVSSDGVLFAHLPHVLFVLHLLYEDFKLDALTWNDAQLMIALLLPLASALKLDKYCDFYWRDFPLVCDRIRPGFIQANDMDKLQPMLQRILNPCHIYNHLLTISRRKKTLSVYPHVKHVNTRSKHLTVLYAILFSKLDNETLALHDYIRDFDWVEHVGRNTPQSNLVVDSRSALKRNAACLLKMVEFQWKVAHVDSLPAGVSLPLRCALYVCQQAPCTEWPDEAYMLIDRQDMLKCPSDASLVARCALQVSRNEYQRRNALSIKQDFEDGMECVVDLPLWKLLFPKDHRVQQIRRLLCSSRPATVVLPSTQQQGLTEHELIDEREKHLLVLCIRVMALPIGRGMFTLHTTTPNVTETLTIPKLCLTGKTQNGTTVDMTHIDVPPNMSLWPQFHNGVATALRISRETSYIDSNWMNLGKNRQPNSEMNADVAGFFLGLGLSGHLSKFNHLALHEHLNRDHEMTQLALVLGLGISHRGTMKADTMRIISAFVESLSPSSTTSIEVAQNIRVAALMAIGFLYQGSAHRYMTEVLLAEIDRPPGPEMENCVDRESYSLSAGLALGLVTLGQGEEMAGLVDLRLADTLYHFMVGGSKRSVAGSSKERNKNTTTSASYQIREGTTVNVDVTAPGSILALGLMFHRTNNRAVAQWMEAPDSQQLLDSIRPDFLLLRTLARGLILWDQVMPTRDWVESNVPTNIRRYSMRNPSQAENGHVDYETMNQAFYNIMAGACMAVGMKFAGSANTDAFNTLNYYAKVLVSLAGRSVAEWAGKATLESCLNVLVLSLSLVMAGTGDLEVLRLCRHLCMRTGSFSNVVTYGSHVATHMALGFLFLGGGRLSLSTSAEAVAALVCACYPKFPTHSNDNRYHLQALRHVYVLAAEPRLLVPMELPNLQACYTNIRLTFVNDVTFDCRAPALLPELCSLKKIQLNDCRYRRVVFDRDHNWQKLINILTGKDRLIVQRKAGCFSYVQDPTGAASLASPTLCAWSVETCAISGFTTDPLVVFLCQQFLNANTKDATTASLNKDLRKLSLVLNDCVAFEKTQFVRTWLQLLQDRSPFATTLALWQIKFLMSCSSGDAGQLLYPELALALQHEIESTYDDVEDKFRAAINAYMSCKDREEYLAYSQQLANFAVYYELPLPDDILRQADNPLSLFMQLGKLGLDARIAARLATILCP